MKFVAISYAISREHIASIHRADCKDVRRDAQLHDGVYEVIEADSAKAALDAYLTDLNADFIAEGSRGWPASSVNVLPCTKGVAR